MQTDEQGLAANLRANVEVLANTPMNLSLAEWSIMSADMLAAADHIEALQQERDALDELAGWRLNQMREARAERDRMREALDANPKSEFCSSCNCDLCQRKMVENSARYALSRDPQTRCWSCSCGWIGCYTTSEIIEYGEPPECQNCYLERLSEVIDIDRIRAALSPTNGGDSHG